MEAKGILADVAPTALALLGIDRARERSLDAALATACVYLSRAFFAKLRSMPARSTAATEDTVPEPLLLTIGPAGVLSSRAITAGELETLLRLLGPPSERQRRDLKRATDIVLVENGKLIYWPRTGEQFADAAYAMARVQASLTS